MDNSQYEKKLWLRWQKQQNEQVANELIQHYMYLVDYHVEKVAHHIPASYDKQDLQSLGIMGLYDALNKFDMKRNVKFQTYASIRIHGSIMDGLRREDWLPRSLRDKANKIEKTSERLEQQLQRIPSSQDIASELNMEVEEVEGALSDYLFAQVQSLDSTYQTDESDDGAKSLSFVENDNVTTPTEHILASELKQELIQSIKQLKENEQVVISLVYVEELSLTEVGEVLELTTSRISQIHKSAVFKLRKILEKIPFS